MFKKILIITSILALAAGSCPASSRLFYLEAQALAQFPFSGDDRSIQWYSMDQMDVMQKPSLGFDYIQRFSGAGGDWGMLAVQARLAYDSAAKHDVEPQLYNAYLKVKPGFGDIWLGHNKPAFGLSSYLDNHGTLLQPLSMYGYGYDRDWGAGYYRDFDWGNAGLSVTSGSGMPLYLKGNYQLSGRVSKGDLNQQNYNIGLSAAYGKNLETMGYHLIYETTMETAMFGADAAVNRDRFEYRTELIRKTNLMNNWRNNLWGCFFRMTANVLEDNRLKLELQYVYDGYDHRLSPGLTYSVTPDLTLRLTGDINRDLDHITAQLYWYHKL